MPRLNQLDRSEMTGSQAVLVETCDHFGAPDAEIASVFVRTEVGRVWLRSWNEILNGGALDVQLKEMCRIYISARHECGYCSTVRSRRAREAGLTDEKIFATLNFEDSALHSDREKAALRFAGKFLDEENTLDTDEAFEGVKAFFSEEEIVELGLLCGETMGVGKFARAIQMRSWEAACEIQPRLTESA